jgi:macrolide phosphotransferase
VFTAGASAGQDAPSTFTVGLVPRSPLALAALSTLAVPGLDVHQVQATVAPDGFESAVAIDAERRRWVVRAPESLAAGAALEAEAAFLSGLESYVDDGRLPFEVPRAAGFAPLPDGGRAIVYPELPGHPLRVERIVPGPGLSASLGRAVAALHELPVSIVENTGLPVYSAEEYRERRLAEVDEAAKTGRVPATLLRRWEKSLEDVSLWRFRPTITHTGLSAETLLVRAGQVCAMTDFFEVQVGDPADDLSWLLATASQNAVDSILEAYQMRRTELIDPHLVDRALLASELALARWLLHGVRNGYADVIEDAVGMLHDLDLAATEVGAFSVAAEDATEIHADGERSPLRGERSPLRGERSPLRGVRRPLGAAQSAAQDEARARARSEKSGAVRAVSGTTPTVDAAHTGAVAAGGTGQVTSDGVPRVESGRGAAVSGATPAVDGSGLGDGDVLLPDYDHALPRPYEDVPTAAYTAAVPVVTGSGTVAVAPVKRRDGDDADAGQSSSTESTLDASRESSESDEGDSSTVTP